MVLYILKKCFKKKILWGPYYILLKYCKKSGIIEKCDLCKSSEIYYDTHHDEIFCAECGVILYSNNRFYLKDEDDEYGYGRNNHKRKDRKKRSEPVENTVAP